MASACTGVSTPEEALQTAEQEGNAGSSPQRTAEAVATSKVVLFCIDALDPVDVAPMRALPNLGRMLAEGAHVANAEPEYPSLTYPCHTSIITGNHVERHGVPHNQMVPRGPGGDGRRA